MNLFEDDANDPIDMLAEKYPVVFKNMNTTLYNSIPPGWVNILDKLCSDLTNLIEEELKRSPPNPDEYPFTVLQIKEKFGGLRFYCQTFTDNEEYNNKINILISKAEDQSYATCATTGNPGLLCRKDGYYETMCEELRIFKGFEVLGNANS
jgi:hypothetical protein